MLHRRALSFVGLILITITSAIWVHAQNSAEIFILSKDIVNDSNGVVTLEFVVRDENNLAANPGNIILNEPTESIDLEQIDRLPITLAVLIDLSLGTESLPIQETLRAYFRSYYREGDDVTFYILDGSGYRPRVLPIANLDEAEQVINGLAPANRFYLLELALEQMLGDLRAKGDIPSQARHVLHVGSYLTAPREAAIANDFELVGIPYHVVKVHSGRPTDDMRALADAGSGLFANNFDSSLVIGGDVAVNELKTLFDTITASRIVNQLSYRTRNTSLDPLRTVRLSIELTGNQTTSTEFNYTWSFAPPTVTFVNIDQLSPFIPVDRDTRDNSLIYGQQTQDVTVSIDFPDQVTRALESIRLEVEETESGDVQQSTLELSPQLDERGNYVLTWVLDEFRQPDTTTPITIRVTVTDELGQVGTVSRSGRVQLGPAPAIPTTVPTQPPEELAEDSGNGEIPSLIIGGADAGPTAVIAVNPLGTPVLDADGNPIIISSGSSSGISNQALVILLLVIAVLVGAIVLVISRLIRAYRLAREEALVKIELPELPESTPRRLRASPIARLQRERDRTRTVVISDDTARPYIYDDDDFDTQTEAEAVMEEEDPLAGVQARLVVNTGWEDIPRLESRVVMIYHNEFDVGRTTENDWQIDMPIISPKHTRFTIEGNRILVRDLGSKNGTYINGERLQVGRDYTAPIGSEVGITANILVQVWDTTAKLNLDELMLTKQGERADSTAADLVFQSPLDDVEFMGGTGEISDDYRPL